MKGERKKLIKNKYKMLLAISYVFRKIKQLFSVKQSYTLVDPETNFDGNYISFSNIDNIV